MIVRLCSALALPAAAAAVVACSEPTACLDYASPALAVRVLGTGGLPVAEGSTVIAIDGAFIDSVVVPVGTGTYNAMLVSPLNTVERPGVYTVRVRRNGYQDGEVANILVKQGRCHVITRTVDVHLVATP